MNQEFLEKIGIEVANVNGEEILFTCPFHDDNTPSASLNTTDLVYNCFVCGGGTLKYLAKQLGHFRRIEKNTTINSYIRKTIV
jgi:DNA primase